MNKSDFENLKESVITKENLATEVKSAIASETVDIIKKISEKSAESIEDKWKELEAKMKIDSGLPGSDWPDTVRPAGVANRLNDCSAWSLPCKLEEL